MSSGPLFNNWKPLPEKMESQASYQALWQHMVTIATNSGFFGPGACGSIYVAESDTVSVSCVSAGTYYAISSMTSGVGYNLTPSGSAGTLTAEHDGIYLLLWSLSVSSDKNADIHGEIFLNSVELEQTAFMRSVSAAASTYGVIAAMGLAELAKDDVLTIRVKSNAANTALSIDHGSLTAIRVM